MQPGGDNIRTELEERLRFETLIADLSSKFINLPAADVDREIEAAQRRVCQCLDVDLSALWQWSVDTPRIFTLTHLYSPPSGPKKPVGIDAEEAFPWVFAKMQQGQTLVLFTEDMPPEAGRDQASRRHFGVKTSVVIPLTVGGEPLVGVLSFDALRAERAWPEDIVQRLELVARVFANALDRKRSEQALRASAARLKLATDCAGLGIWELDCGTNLFWATARARKLFGYAPDEPISLARFEESVHPEDRERVRQAIGRAVREGDSIHVEYRITAENGQLKWILSRGGPCSNPADLSKRLMGASVDISERKQAEEQLQHSHAEIEQLKNRLQAESECLKAEIKLSQDHGEVIGQSRPIKQVLGQIEQVAPTDSSVLIYGQTGTGKELVAQAIHRLSQRQDRVMVKVNCAALPSALVESELFGREKGAFTGAMTRQVGRFEVADGSTLFLDEVGELSLEVQAKLLRVLQEGQFERLGSPKTIEVNVRVIAATNHDLAAAVREGRFREDLYYRLNVFPIRVPPLRERTEDIPMMVWAFLEEFSSRMGKKITRVSRQTMESLQRRDWPGNVRQLRNVIEHGAILTTGDTLNVPLTQDHALVSPSTPTLADAEREHILNILERTQWRVKGARGAAALLGLNPSTLYSRMEKLGIPTRRQKESNASSIA